MAWLTPHPPGREQASSWSVIPGTISAGGLESTKTNSSPKGLSLSAVCSSISDGFV
ncbi:hypothetical protein E4U15_004360 [Claviceps sp. LM218 group G6]|nr:hypothetical protein E4U15_004360 [Claviceps sp. LM218 group G6]